MSALPRKLVAVQRPSGRVAIMCEINDRTWTAEVPPEVGNAFLEQVFDLFMRLAVAQGLGKLSRLPKN